MPQCKIYTNPINEVVFERPLDELVEEIGGD